MSRFLMFGANYWPEPIGCAQYTTPYAEALVDAGHEVTVVAAYPHYPAWSREEVRLRPTRVLLNGVHVIRVPVVVPREATASGRAALEASYGAMALACSVAARDVDAVVSIVPFLSAGLAAAATSALRRRSHGVLVQDMVSAAARQGGVPGGARTSSAIARAERLFLSAARVAVVARGFEQPARDLGATEVDYLPNFSLLGSPRSTPGATRDRLAIPTNAFVAMYSGNLGYKQDFGSVLDAAGTLAGIDSEVLFVIIGDGSQKAWIEQEIRARRLPNVLLRPLQAEEDLPDVLSAADVLLAPQRPTEVDMSVPSKLTAYLSAGRAVIAGASPQSETARIVEESRGGLVVAPSDGQAVAEAVLALRRDTVGLARFAASGRAHADAAFSRAPALARFVSWSESLLPPVAIRS